MAKFVATKGAATTKGTGSYWVGLNGITDNGEIVYIDRAKAARGWSGQSLAPLTAGLDSTGNPVALNSGDTAFEFFFSSFRDSVSGFVGTPPDRGGRFRVTWQGEATITFSGGTGTNRTDLSANSFEFDCDWIGNKSFIVTPTNLSNLPRNISIVKTTNLAAYAAGEYVDPNNLASLPQNGGIRFMDAMGTNSSSIVNWWDYPTTSNQTWQRMPFAVMVDIMNRRGCDGWFCWPYMATDAFATTMATYLRDNLQPLRRISLEYSNELWNFGAAFNAQFVWLKAQCLANWGIADAGLNGEYFSYAGKRYVEMMRATRTVFAGQTHRLRGVCSGQAASTNPAIKFADSPDWLIYEPANYAAPKTLSHYLAIGPYINWTSPGATSRGNDIKTQLDISNAAAVTYIKGMFAASLTQAQGWIDAHIPVANARGLQLVAYEYNNHYNLEACNASSLYSGGSPVAGALQAFMDATYSSEMATTQDSLRTYFKNAGGGAMCFFVNVNGASRFGTWGARTHLEHTSAIATALEVWHAGNPRWWRR